MSFRLDTPYYEIPGSKTAATFGTVVEILLKTRLKLRLDTSREPYDEDVNAYLAGVLISYIDPTYLREISEVLTQYDIDVYHAVEKAQDKVEVYRIYKVNADDLLISLGLFRRLWQEADEELARLKIYYSCACEYQRRIYGKPTAVGEIQAKLAEESWRYLAILASARCDYLHLIGEVKSEELSEEVRRFEEELAMKVKRDEFLDLYSAWLKGARDTALRVRILQLVGELQCLDPAFQPPQL